MKKISKFKYPDISIVMSAFNEEKNLKKAYDELESSLNRLKLTYQIILINDGSTDDTKKICKQISSTKKNIRFINNSKNLGLGRSFKNSISLLKGKSTTLFPSDGENNSFEVLRFLKLMDDVDLIIPFYVNKYKRSLSRKMISLIYKNIINLSFGLSLNYTNSACIYNTGVLKKLNLKTSGFFFQTELIIKAIKSGYLYAEVPSFINKRSSGSSSAFSLKNLSDIVISYFSLLLDYYFKKNNFRIIKSSESIKRWKKYKNQ